MFDEERNIERRSCLGKYGLKNGIPINPKGRTGLSGRGTFKYWGPNHSIQAIFTRFNLQSILE